MQPLLSAPRRPACGCGYADVEEMKKAAAAAAQEPQLTIAEKNTKKIAAVHATREHGKQLFQAGDYAAAFAVYERGVLICSGIYGVEPSVQEELTQLECLLDINMAMCQLKLHEYPAAMDQCRMALQLDPKNVKAHFRMAQAEVGMGEYGRAREQLNKCTELDQTGACKREIAALLQEIRAKEAAEAAKVKHFTHELQAKLASQAAFAASPSGKLEEEEKSNSDDVPPAAQPVVAAASPATAVASHDLTHSLAQSLRDAALNRPAPEEDSWNVDGPKQQPAAIAEAKPALS
jgi:tetratricopeptide (TPR) repeat protein